MRGHRSLLTFDGPHFSSVILLVLAGQMSISTAAADDLWVPLRETRVRVTGFGGSPVVGVPLESRGDTLALQDGRKIIDVPIREIERFEVRKGLSRSTGSGAFIGLLVGGGLGALAGAGSEGDAYFSRGANIFLGTLMLGLPGAALGALIGHSCKHEQWQEVPDGGVAMDPRGAVWAPISPTQRVRASAPLWERGSITGTVRSLDADSLVLTHGGRTITLPRPLIRKLETSWSRKPRGGYGALIGFGAGFAFGVVLHEINKDNSAIGAGFAWGLVVGAPVGSVVGAQIKVPDWREIPITPPPLQTLDQAGACLSPESLLAQPLGASGGSAPADSLGGGR